MNKYILLLVVLGFGLITYSHLGLLFIEDEGLALENYVYNFKLGLLALFSSVCLKTYEDLKS